MPERSSKRRKIDHVGEVVPAAQQSPTNYNAPVQVTGRKSVARGTKQQHDEEADDTIAVTRRPVDKIAKHDDEIEDLALAEDTTIRASGRKRKPPAKLKEDAARDAKSTKPRSKARTPMKPRHNSEQSSRADVVEDVIEVVSTLDKAHTATGKENEAPLEHDDDADRQTELAMLRAQMALELHEELEPPVPSDTNTSSDQDRQALLDPNIARPWTSEALSEIRHSLLSQITSNSTSPINLEEEYEKVHEIVNQAVETGESNSIILIGSRGAGKTTLVNHVLKAQRERYPDDFHIVRLNGFIHTDDKLALRDIWRQLGRDVEPDVNDDTIHSYADTLAMLLALLSDPEELGQSSRTGHMAKSVIFVLDEFDLFATHPRQTLLYNLFDIAQSRKAPIAVLGLTTRVDIVEALEKRVKSRFSHRYVHFGLAKSLSVFKQICASFLTLHEDHSMSQMWTGVVEALQAHDRYHQHISKIYYRSKSVADFLATLLVPVASLDVQSAKASKEIVEHMASALSMAILGPDSKLDLLPSLSSLQLALLVCAARQSAVYNTDNVTFNLVYEEYKSLAGKAKLQATASGAMAAGGRVLGKDVAKIAWHELVDIGFVLEDGRGFGKVDIALEEIAGSGADLGVWSRWCKEI